MVSKSYLLLLVVMPFIQCCQPSILTEEELSAYLLDESNGLSQSKQVGNIKMQVTYRPTDLLVMQELDDPKNPVEIENLRSKYSNYHYFIMSLSAGEKDALYGASVSQAQFSDNLQTLSFRMGQYVQMLADRSDTIPVADYTYNRNFGMSTSSNLLFVFSREQAEEAKELTFQTKEFGLGTGIQNFRFETNRLSEIPKLKELTN